MAKSTKHTKSGAARLEKRGGYSSGTKPISQLKPPPKGPATGAKPKVSSAKS